MIYTKETASQPMIKLMECLHLDKLNVEEGRDREGCYYSFRDLGQSCYKRSLNEFVDTLIKRYKVATSPIALKFLKDCLETKDNEYNSFLGYREYEIVKVEVNKTCVPFGVLLRFKDNGEELHFLTTNLSYALGDYGELMKYVSICKRYYTAGGLKESDVDFIFGGVGHSTKRRMYCRDDEEILQGV